MYHRKFNIAFGRYDVTSHIYITDTFQGKVYSTRARTRNFQQFFEAQRSPPSLSLELLPKIAFPLNTLVRTLSAPMMPMIFVKDRKYRIDRPSQT